MPRDFFDAVRAEAGAGSSAARAGVWITPQTRDMNPVYTGKDVSYIDTKQAQRAIETAVAEAERFATAAWLDGAPYPARGRWTRRGGCSPTARTTTRSPGSSPTRSTWTWSEAGGRPGI